MLFFGTIFRSLETIFSKLFDFDLAVKNKITILDKQFHLGIQKIVQRGERKKPRREGREEKKYIYLLCIKEDRNDNRTIVNTCHMSCKHTQTNCKKNRKLCTSTNFVNFLIIVSPLFQDLYLFF